MKKLFAIITIICASCWTPTQALSLQVTKEIAPSTRPESVASPIEGKLQAILDQVLSEHPDSIGLMAHIESPHLNVSWSGAAGHSDKMKKNPIEPSQPALIASNTKTYMAAAILRLVEQKQIGINEPIKSLILPASAKVLAGDGYDLNAIQISHLLSHTSGIHDYINDDYMLFAQSNPKHRWTREEQIKLAAKVGDPLGSPGEVFQYADINFLLLGEVLERKTGKSFYEAIRQLVRYDSLNLNQTWFATLEEKPSSASPLVHQYVTSLGFDSYEVDPSFDLYGAGGIAASTKDLARFSQSLFNGKIVRDPTTLKLIFSPAKTRDNVDHHYHFGLSSSVIAGHQAYGHGGFWGTVVQYIPELDTSIAVFVLERDKRELRADLLERFVNAIAAERSK